MHYAAAAGELDLVRYLIERGADPAAVETGYGADPAGWAEHFGHPEIAAHLRALSPQG